MLTIAFILGIGLVTYLIWWLFQQPRAKCNKEPGLKYYLRLVLEVFIYPKLLKSDYISYLFSQSVDGGHTCPLVEPGCTAILSHQRCTEEMETYSQRWSAGKIHRGNYLGRLWINSILTEDVLPTKHLTHNATVKQHALVRPILQDVIGPDGNWTKKDIFDHASKFLENKISLGQPLRVPEDIFAWTCIMLHKYTFFPHLT